MSQAFIENASLLVITAILTGILVPAVKGFMDNRTFERQKRYEAALNRQTKIIESQSQLLDEVTKALWEFRYIAMEVSVYGSETEKGGQKYTEIVTQYLDKAWDILARLRVSMSKSRRLISEDAYQKLVVFYQWLTLEFDPKVRNVIKTKAGYRELNSYIYTDVTNKIDEILHSLAIELNLVVEQSK